MRYLEELKQIWKNLVPEEGQADNLQGELLRQVEKLRYEAQNNGNINWDSNFEFFCEFLQSSLCGSGALSDKEKAAVSDALQRMKSAGQVAYKFAEGEISDEELEDEFQQRDGLAYVGDDLYDLICEAIGVFYIKYETPIPYKPNPDIYR